jgi:hypothetical protein
MLTTVTIHQRPFRFGVDLHGPLPGRSWADSAREVEALGLSRSASPGSVLAVVWNRDGSDFLVVADLHMLTSPSGDVADLIRPGAHSWAEWVPADHRWGA